MIAVDANVLVRLFVADDELQATRAARLLASGQRILVAKTVILELVWVLSAVYETPRPDLVHALEMLAGLREVEIEDRPAVEQAITLYARGLDDFADALHVCSSAGSDAFATFDRKLIVKARKLGGPVPVRLP